jgi:hypothetical protein
MRDIREDLQDRASFVEEQISAAHEQFEERMEQLKREHQAKIENLQSELEAVTTLLEGEYRRLTSEAPAQEERRHPSPVEPERETYGGQVAAEADDRPQPSHRPATETEEPYRHQPVAEGERRRRLPEQEPYRRPAVAETDAPGAPEREPVRRPVHEAEYQQRRAEPEPGPYRRPVHEAEPEHRSTPPQVYRRAPAAEAAPRREPQRQPQQQPQQPPLADFLIHKLSKIGAMSLEDLCVLSVQEGYFAEGENPEQAVHGTLMNVVKAGFIRQLPNGTFAPATVMDTIRLRRAI